MFVPKKNNCSVFRFTAVLEAVVNTSSSAIGGKLFVKQSPSVETVTSASSHSPLALQAVIQIKQLLHFLYKNLDKFE